MKEKIIKILEGLDEIHSDGFALPEYLDKIADQILSLIESRLPEKCVIKIKKFEPSKIDEKEWEYLKGFNNCRQEVIKLLKEL
jgi:hypothetical protein